MDTHRNGLLSEHQIAKGMEQRTAVRMPLYKLIVQNSDARRRPTRQKAAAV